MDQSCDLQVVDEENILTKAEAMSVVPQKVVPSVIRVRG